LEQVRDVITKVFISDLKDPFIEIKDQLKSELRREFQSDFDHQLTNSLLDEIQRHETVLIIKSPVWSNGINYLSFVKFCMN
jgi:hypothetical protein